MPTLNLVEGKLSVVIEAPSGDESDYFVEELPPPRGATWRVRLTHLLDDKRSYTVTCRPGAWHCDCADFKYRPAKRLEGCKHCKAARAVRELLEALREGIAPKP